MRSARVSGWSRADTVALLAIVALAGLLRLWSLGTPDRIVFDEVYYAPDACLFVESPTVCERDRPFTEEHPFLGKWLIASAIAAIGFEPIGWRAAPLVLGVAGVGLTYVLGRRLLGSTWAASAAAILMAVDLLHFAMSRVAMLDIFVATFALAGVLFAVLDRDRVDPGLRTERLRDRPWLIASGAALGAALASKWSGAFFLVAVAVAVISWDAARARDERWHRRWWVSIRAEWMVLLVALLVIPIAVYVVSFGNRFDGTLLALPWDRRSWWWDLARRQVEMLRFHIDLSGPYPYVSPAWSWPLVKRPVIMAFDDDGGAIRQILAFGNPLVWWPALATAVVMTVRWVRGVRGPAHPEGVLLLGVAAGYLPWLVLTAPRSFSFIFYLLPAVPFLSLALARALQVLARGAPGRAAAVGYVALAISLFAFFYPVLTARPLSGDAWLARMWFRDCRAEQFTTDPPHPLSKPGPPPEGWCWV